MLHSLLRRSVFLFVIVSMLIPHTPAIHAAPSAALDLFFSEYVEGSSDNKALEIFNGTGADIDLSSYTIQFYFNRSTSPGASIQLSGTILANETFVLADDGAVQAILDVADQLYTGSFFNGDDVVVLRNGSAIIDSIGRIGEDLRPATQWGSGLQSTADNTLRRNSSICQGDTNPDDALDPSIEWDGFEVDTFGGLGSHTMDATADCSAATAALLADFATAAREDHVLIEWATLMELNHMGFNLYRATAGATPTWTKLNEIFITGAEPGSFDGQSYQWEDYTVSVGQHYLYRLEAVDMNGKRESFAEQGVIFGPNRVIWLPLLQAR
jgi:hypothetical protein